MADLFTLRDEVSLYRFPGLFYPLAAVVALALQAYLPLLLHWTVYLDLPLLVVVYYAINSRQPAGSMLTGAGLGILQDGVAHLALGLNGIAKTLVGCLASSLGGKLDAEHSAVRFLIVAGLYGLNATIIFLIEKYLMAKPVLWWGSRLALAALLNGVIAVLIFRLFDRFRHVR